MGKLTNDTVSVDTEAVQKKFKELNMTSSEARKSIKSALRASMKPVRQAVMTAASGVTSNSTKVRKGVTLTVYRNGSGALVHIMKPFYLDQGNKRGVFRLMWLEEGTRNVVGRNKKMHGATPAHHFFAQAVRSSEGEAQRTLSDNLLKSIDKIAAKRSK